jgi:hypothetical protein
MAFVYRMFVLLVLALPLTAVAAPKPKPTPLNTLQGEALTYYVQSFNSTMERGKPDKPYAWKTVGGKGQFVVGPQYTSKSKALCRDYSESYVLNKKIGAIPAPGAPAPANSSPDANNTVANSESTTGTATGIACQRSAQTGWCRLGAKDARTCALEKSQSGFDRTLNIGRGLLR